MAAEGSYVQPAIPKFDGHYDHWSMLMENFLRSKEYWSLVEDGIAVPENGDSSSGLTEAQKKTMEDQKLKDLKVKNYLFQAIDRSIMETILVKDTSKQIWDSMKLKYQGNNSKMSVMGKGNIKLEVEGVTHVMTNVFYIPELANNLLSIGQLQEKGLAILIQNGACKIYHPIRGLIFRSQMTANRMFVLLAKAKTQSLNCLQAIAEDTTDLWHRRYGHLNNKSLRTLQQKELVKGLPQLKAVNKVCTVCNIGKQHRQPIPKKIQWRASQRLQLIHADICGPITPISSSNKRYILSFIDDYSRKNWVYFLAAKSEAFTSFKNFKCLVEKEVGSSLCCLRTDRGGEFTSDEFNNFCETHNLTD